MKKLTLFTSALFITSLVLGQDVYKKKYLVNYCVEYSSEIIEDSSNEKETKDIKYLVKDSTIKISDIPECKCRILDYDKIKKKGDTLMEQWNKKKGSVIEYSTTTKVNGKEVTVHIKDSINERFIENQTIDIQLKYPYDNLKAMIKQVGDKVYVNPYLRKGKDGNYENRDVYYFKLENRQSIKFDYREHTVSALTIPIKYRFGNKTTHKLINGERNKTKDVKENFTTSLSGYVLVTRSLWGGTRFLYREKMDNKQNSWKVTVGAFVGVSSITFDTSNTNSADSPIIKDVEVNSGLVSYGIGLFYSFNKFNLGLMTGQDYGVGSYANKWNYQGDIWIGAGIGYAIF